MLGLLACLYIPAYTPIIMPVLLELLERHVNGDVIRGLSSKIDGDETGTRHAVAAALPLFIGALARQANESQGQAQALIKALNRDHDGSLLDNLGPLLHLSAGGHSLTDAGSGYAGGYTIDRCAADGDGILRHVFGDRRSAVENGISRASGLDVRKVSLLMPILATIVMSAAGKLKSDRNLDADGIARLLNRERLEAERETPAMNRGGLLDFMDSEDDGAVIEEVARIGSAFQERTFKAGVAGR